ncbi:MAG TPA: hypothetical protein VMK53_05605 [Gemmatimonadales bacterium]|nr:hypothetical protein [Gemmatimonadales bacterium]
MAASRRNLLLLLVLVGAPSLAASQVPAEVIGQVVRRAGTDTLPVSAAGIVLHRIGQNTQGPIDSMQVDREGRFRFRFQADTSAAYILSVRHHGITYFSSPVARDPANRTDDILLIVSDTSSSAPVSLAARSLIVGGAEPSGSRTVVEVIELANRGQATRVSADSVPTFALGLGRGGHGHVIEDTDLSPDAVLIRNDSLLVFAPLAPGERVVIIQYVLPAGVGRLELPPGPAVDTMQVLLETGQLELLVDLPRAADENLDGRPYGRWVGPWPAGQPLAVAVTGVNIRPDLLLGILIGVLMLAMAAGMVLAHRRRSAGALAPVARAGLRPAELIDALAKLDARYRGRERDTDPVEWQQYQGERARLKAALERALASGGATS